MTKFIRGKAIPGERVGLLSGVTAGGKPVTSWDNYSLPIEAPEKLLQLGALRGSMPLPRQLQGHQPG